MFSYISPERGVPKDHPLRAVRKMVDEVLVELSPRFKKLYSATGRPSIAPEKLLRALLLQILYSVRRKERMLMERLNYNMLFRWFVGLSVAANCDAFKRRHLEVESVCDCLGTSSQGSGIQLVQSYLP
jgi:transposase